MNKKKLSSLSFRGWVLTSVIAFAFTLSPVQAKLRSLPEINSDSFLEIMVIAPPHHLNWTSPKTLFKTSSRNAVSTQLAPNGHLIIHLKSRFANEYGLNEVLTGMTRTNMMGTAIATVRKKYGLSAMFQDFSGDLDSAETTREEIEGARRQGRFSSLWVPISDEKAKQMYQFLGAWIRKGAYKHYRGNQDVSKGTGSGCADFAEYFLRIALNGYVPENGWRSEVYLPWDLLQEAPGRGFEKISALKFLTKDIPWGTSPESGVFFSIPDPEKMQTWIVSNSPVRRRVQLVPSAVVESDTAHFRAVQDLNPPFPVETEAAVKEKWKSIGVFH